MDRLNVSAENYLKTIYVLQQDKDQVRSVDVARKLDFSKPSVSRAVEKLTRAGLIYMDKHNFLNFTKKGEVQANEIFEREEVIKKILAKVGLDEKIIETDAGKIEHAISSETFEALKKYMEID